MRILLVVYDNDSYIHWFPQGLAYIAAVLLKEGYDVEIYNQDQNHYTDEHLTAYLNDNNFDIVWISVIAGYYQYRKLLKLWCKSTFLILKKPVKKVCRYYVCRKFLIHPISAPGKTKKGMNLRNLFQAQPLSAW